MSEKENVMTVTLMRTDLYDALGYTGSYLTLPASKGKVQDALHRARIMDGQPYQIVECMNMEGVELCVSIRDGSFCFFIYNTYAIMIL